MKFSIKDFFSKCDQIRMRESAGKYEHSYLSVFRPNTGMQEKRGLE